MVIIMSNEISYGLSSLYYARKSGSGYAVPKPIPGAVKINLNPEEYVLTFTGLDCIPREKQSIVYGYKGSVVIAGLPADFYRDIYGYESSAGGGLIEKISDSMVESALLFETDGIPASRYCYYSCRFGAHEFAAETKTKSVSVSTITVPITLRAGENGKIKHILPYSNSAAYQNWFKEV